MDMKSQFLTETGGIITRLRPARLLIYPAIYPANYQNAL
jgi:hypothetical protein